MNCSDARKVWGHPDGFVAGLEEVLPGVFERIAKTVSDAMNGRTNPFLQVVRGKVGEKIQNPFYATHAQSDDKIAQAIHGVLGDLAGKAILEAHFSKKYGKPIFLGNICCEGCNVSIGAPLTLEESVALQLAAVTTGPNGEELS